MAFGPKMASGTQLASGTRAQIGNAHAGLAQAGNAHAGLWRLFPPLTLLVFLGPVLAGLLGTLLPAIGILPALGGTAITLEPWQKLVQAPGLGTALRLSLTVGLGAALLAFLAAAGLVALVYGTPWLERLRLATAPLLAVPHAAFAVGFMFLIAPSGWLARLISPWATGWERPPDILTVQDPFGLALMLGLAAKETFFLVLVLLAALAQVPAEAQIRVARSLGYGRSTAFAKVVLPQLYGQIRLPLYAVLVFGSSVVDMAVVLGPATPPTLAVMVLQWTQDPDLTLRFQAAAGALLQAVAALLAVGLWRLGELAVAVLARRWLAGGGRRGAEWPVRLAGGLALGAMGMVVAGILVMAVWSVTDRWRFPEDLPQGLSLAVWGRAGPALGDPLATTLLLALASSGIALALVLGCLEHEQRAGLTVGRRALGVLYLPLLLPQIGFLFGTQVLLAALGIAGSVLAVLWLHLIFVVPYVFLVLADPWRSLDPRYARTALCLGKSPTAVFWRVKLALLKRPVLVAGAVGFGVSVALYLPTVFAGGGRVPTLATEVVSLAAGGDRRQLGAFGLLQAVLPLLALLAAAWLGRGRFHRRGAGSRHGA